MKGEEQQDEEQECVCTPIEKKKVDFDPSKIKLSTCPVDPRFQQTNQTNYCYFSFIDWHRCIRLLGDDYPGCFLFLQCWKSLCPNNWTDRWFDQMNNGIFPRRIYPPRDPPFESPPWPQADPRQQE